LSLAIKPSTASWAASTAATGSSPGAADPLGAAAGGLIGETLGLRAVFGGAGALILLTLIGMTTVTDAAIAAAEQDPHD